jgi:hypothetical protein
MHKSIQDDLGVIDTKIQQLKAYWAVCTVGEERNWKTWDI